MVPLVLCSSTNMDKSQHAQAALTESTVMYAGFWLRLAASLVDILAMFIPFCFVAFIVTVIVKLVSTKKGYDPAVVILALLPVVAIITTWLYFALMESSSWQATLGKKLLGLYVTDISGQRLSLSRATGRTFAKYLSSITAGIGYLMCAFTAKKQALHDMVANCLVLRSPR
jgi:uncharacterized RDD family membrane protein YckC